MHSAKKKTSSGASEPLRPSLVMPSRAITRNWPLAVMLLGLLAIWVTLSTGCRKCPTCKTMPPRTVTVEAKCMNPLPKATAKLAAETPPLEPGKVLSLEHGRKHRALLVALTDYIATELARCGKKTTTP